jgi:hypothetical protein
MWVVIQHYLLFTRTHPYFVTLLPIDTGYFRAKTFPVWIPQHFWNLVILHLPGYEDETECSETSAYKIQAPWNYPEESIKIALIYEHKNIPKYFVYCSSRSMNT